MLQILAKEGVQSAWTDVYWSFIALDGVGIRFFFNFSRLFVSDLDQTVPNNLENLKLNLDGASFHFLSIFGSFCVGFELDGP